MTTVFRLAMRYSKYRWNDMIAEGRQIMLHLNNITYYPGQNTL